MSRSEKPVTACLIIIGNEILSGRTVDANLPYVATALGSIGIRLAEARVVPDIEAEIADAVNACRGKHTYVFTTGGIGPTHDDITAASIAKAFGLPFGRNAEAERRLLAYYPPERVNPARMKMADAPEGAELIDNPVSVAPGFRVENVYVLPGVPKIMQAMLDSLLPKLEGGARVLSRAITV
ncbi:MAG: competence/damage-inducible protein A, partial [Geminicoccales bacterium]